MLSVLPLVEKGRLTPLLKSLAVVSEKRYFEHREKNVCAVVRFFAVSSSLKKFTVGKKLNIT